MYCSRHRFQLNYHHNYIVIPILYSVVQFCSEAFCINFRSFFHQNALLLAYHSFSIEKTIPTSPIVIPSLFVSRQLWNGRTNTSLYFWTQCQWSSQDYWHQSTVDNLCNYNLASFHTIRTTYLTNVVTELMLTHSVILNMAHLPKL